MHTDTETLERMKILRGLRANEFDVLVGINLLREGLDLPEVSLIAILDADREGFLRSETSLIQTVGRAARNSAGLVIMYGDTVTRSMEAAIRETERRRAIQTAYNEKHGITPTTIVKKLNDIIEISESSRKGGKGKKQDDTITPSKIKYTKAEKQVVIAKYKQLMLEASKILDFENAAYYRDIIAEIEAG
jgi:excinuclease ABC subunit B